MMPITVMCNAGFMPALTTLKDRAIRAGSVGLARVAIWANAPPKIRIIVLCGTSGQLVISTIVIRNKGGSLLYHQRLKVWAHLEREAADACSRTLSD